MSQIADSIPNTFEAIKPDYRSMLIIAATLAGMFAVFTLAVMFANQGHFAYTLDAGTYTHMALAKQILQGGYGLNPGEFTAPSSNILYPFILALLSFFGAGQFSPFLVCIAATLALSPLICNLAAECQLRLERVPAIWLVALTVSIALALNLIGLAFTGLEHSLHIFLTITCLLGLLRFIRRNETDWWWLVAIIILPLIRYEALAALLADVVLLVLFRKYRYAFAIAATSLSLVLSFSLYLHAQGLSYLPNSVLFRSHVATSSLSLHSAGLFGFVQALATTLQNNIFSFGATHIIFLLLVICWSLSNWRRPATSQRSHWVRPAVVGFCVMICSAQLVAGSLQSHSSRYEAYVLALEACTILICYKDTLLAFVNRFSTRNWIYVCASILVLGSGYAIHTLDIVSATKVVYEGPYQIRRFVVDYYKQPIASTHPGLINNNNPYYVLDLSGQISEASRKAITTQADPQWMDRLTRERGIGLAILHSDDEVLPPPQWLPVGKLETRNSSMFSGTTVATIYATTPRDKDVITARLREFAPSLPAGTRLTLAGADDRSQSVQ
ncbi:hypothetical protein [Andreprevotia chitinilytica]|uniref:hypothetical protein n=1 Tax=Andreprevotia chitinilytica TaxID=396808 RepID=UPI00054FC156|nr:hypothetical protein [Andreprevotia chitinilytica]